MTKDGEIEMLNRRIKGWQQNCVDEFHSNRKKVRKLRKEIKSLRTAKEDSDCELARAKEVINQYEESCKRYHKSICEHEAQKLSTVELITSLGKYDHSQSLYANVAAALARAALGKRG